ncbi:MAG: hypothetical protein GC162_15915 [Planctomycetes bacterium]|nr:hypothetical protein [Planctomycetota bacterium]
MANKHRRQTNYSGIANAIFGLLCGFIAAIALYFVASLFLQTIEQQGTLTLAMLYITPILVIGGGFVGLAFCKR